MATEIIMPKVDMVMETGTFVEWLKQEGEAVEKGEPLFVVLTDKANIEIEAPASGILAGLTARPNDVIPVTQTIGYILAPGEALPVPGTPAPQVATATAPRPEQAAMPSPAVRVAETGGKVRATPAARRLAAKVGLALTALPPGRGPAGRIHKADVEAAVQAPRSGDTVTAPPGAPVPSGLRLPQAKPKLITPLTGPRKIIAERMAYSAVAAPHITLSLRVDMSEATRLRAMTCDHMLKQTGQRPSFTAIVARAVAAVLPRHPYLNASLDGDRVIAWEEVHLGIATSLEDYLVVPVIREAQGKSLAELVAAMADLLERARARRLTPAEMSGSTFTISNLGMFGIESFTAIINPPETAILAVGQIVDTPVGSDGGIVLRPLMNLTLSVDHRVVDGAGGARFLADLKMVLENPYLLI
jgi:pyruvate dehydrogenase E2 component (dihydrolipoamide acetyltransferase)